MICSLFNYAIADSSSQSLDSIKIEIKFLSENLKKSKDSKNQIYKQLQQQSRIIFQLNESLFYLSNKLKQKTQELSLLDRIKFNQRHAQDQQISALSNQVREAYIRFRHNYIEILLSDNNPAELARIRAYYRYLYIARQQQLMKIRDRLENLTQKQNSISDAQKNRKQLHQQQQEKKQMLRKQNKKSQEILASLEKEIVGQDNQLRLLKQKEYYLLKSPQSIDKYLTETKKSKQQIVSKYKPFSSRRGSLNWPIKGKLLAQYGKPQNIGKLTWKGIVISATTGNDIVASAPGKVIFANWLRGFGLLIIIDHGDQYMTLYGNNRILLKRVGEDVLTNEPIAQSGVRIMHEHSGLYFEIRYKGKPTNPLEWLKETG